MKISRSFDMHGLAGFRLFTDDRQTADYFSAEYAFARDQLAGDVPIVELRWRISGLPRSPGPGYRLQIHKAAARWHYRIELLETGVLIEGVGNRAATPMVHHMLLHPALRWLASQRKILMLHAASVARSGNSLLISGAGGAGKTTTSSALLARGDSEWRLQGDDYVFIGTDGMSFAYGTRSHLYLDLVLRFPELSKRLTWIEQRRLRANWILRRLSGDRIKLPVRVEFSRIWPNRNLAISAQPAAMLLLRASKSIRPQLVRASDYEAVIDELLDINFYEARHFINLVGEPGNWLEVWMARERSMITELVQRVPAFELHLPRGSVDLEPALLELLEKEVAAHGSAAEV
ncbi:MAG: hypothetical protein ACE5JF_09230 [Anaerolineales bacterium]